MPGLSKRADRIKESPIRKLVPIAEATKKRGTQVFHLNIGQPDIKTPKRWFEAIEKADTTVLKYSQSAGMPELREAIQGYYRRLGHELAISNINVTTGASEALSFVFASIMDEGDQVIVPEPFYANYNSFSLGVDAEVVPLTTRLEDDFALPEPEAFAEKITDKTKAILICNPGNPTGILYPETALKKLADIAREKNIYLIADEVYREFTYGEERHTSILSFDHLHEQAIVVDSVSKRFSACGARIGCIISRNDRLMNAVLKFSQARLCSPTLGQIGATAVYDLPTSFYEEVKAEYKRRKETLVSSLRNIPGVICPEINGAFYAIVRLPVKDSEHFCKWMLEDFSYEGATVMMAPAAGFYKTAGLGLDEVRIAYVLKEEDLQKAMTCLEKGLEAYPAERKKLGSVQMN
ncbi:MAG: pyridoxal phosphate-dependent aminotransferase [Bacteroidota bacterium]